MKIKWFVISIAAISLFLSASVNADESDIFMSQIQPNVLFILDNSNSMDEDFYGNALGSYATGSKSVEARRSLINIVNAYVNNMRLGLMAYQLPSASKMYIHNSGYFISYDPRSYCPKPPSDCTNYCITGNIASKNACQTSCQAQNSLFDATYGFNGTDGDEIIQLPIGNALRTAYCPLVYPKTVSLPNPSDMTHNIYYAQALPFYDSGNDGIAFLYSPGYNALTQSNGAGQGPYNVYDIWINKTGTSDGSDTLANGYLNYWFATGLVPTDSDVAIGYYNFGRRLFWAYVGPTWFANSSPGGGYLHVAGNTNNQSTNTQLNALLAKLAMHENDQAGYMSCSNTGNPNSCPYIVNAGLTPTAGTLQSAINDFQGVSGYTSPITDHCQQNFVVYATDGLPSNDESGNSGSASSLMPAVLSKITALRSVSKSISGTSYNFDINTYVLGMGLTDSDKVLLDQMAVAGGADVGGHAYYADNSDQLTTNLNNVLANIIERAFSFTTTSVASSRFADENYLYEASFEPVNFNSFWKGHLQKYQINTDGSIGSMVWDAGSVLQSQLASSRNILTYESGTIQAFNTGNITRTDLGVSTDAQRDAIVGYVRGDPTYNPDNWKLGDIFHSNIISVGTPSSYWNDTRDHNVSSGMNAFTQFRANNQRTTANGKRIVLAGANDGQFHSFRASDGVEMWSFIPPNFLPKLSYLAHSSNPTTLTHQYFADGPVVVSDAWFGSGDGTSKNVSDWQTLAVFSVGRNDAIYDDTVASNSTKYWSSSPTCDAGLSDTYNSTTAPYYCGYYAFNFTNTLSPVSKWRLNTINPNGAALAPYLGEPWGKMAIGKVIISGNEKWVGFIGGGYNYCPGSTACTDNRGKGFYVVDLSNGSILWSYTGTTYSIAASPATVDYDNDGFIDTVYVGDMGGNIWRFNFCTSAQASGVGGCDTSGWSGGKLYAAPNGEAPIYTSVTGAKDSNGTQWIYWGTGDKVNPKSSSGGRLYGVMDTDRSSTYHIGDLKDITSTTFVSGSDNQKGWYINLSGTGEKSLADPVIFAQVLYFSTYTPYLGTDQCMAAGTGTLYAINYLSGGAVIGTGRQIDTGVGLATSPLISTKPGGAGVDLYITFSGGGASGASTDEQIKHRNDIPTDPVTNRLLYWKDKRVQ